MRRIPLVAAATMPVSCHPIDAHVGGRIRERRLELGMSDEQLAAALGLALHEVQKYELGVDRVAASRLYDLGQALDVAVAYFFEGLESGEGEPRTDASCFPADGGRELVALVRAYLRIRDADVRRTVFALIETIADSGSSS